jgi:hypothetical protein
MKTLKDLKINDTVYSIYDMEIRQQKVSRISVKHTFLQVDGYYDYDVDVKREPIIFAECLDETYLIKNKQDDKPQNRIYFNRSEAIEDLKKIIFENIKNKELAMAKVIEELSSLRTELEKYL